MTTSGGDSTRPLEMSVEIDGEAWAFVLDYRAYTAIEEETGIDLTTEAGQERLEDGGIDLRRALFHEGFKSGLYHTRKRELVEGGMNLVEARTQAMQQAKQLGADVVMAELTPSVLQRLNEQMDEIHGAMQEAADEQEEMLEEEEADDPLATSASGGRGDS